MTADDHLDRLDDLASAHLDGATSAEEAAEVAADPAVQARVQELRAVREAIRAIPVVDAARRETAIAAAMDAFEEQAAHGERPPGTVTLLSAVAARRRPSSRALRLLGAAAAIVLLAALVPLLTRLGGSRDADTASRVDTTFQETGDSTGDGAPDAASGAAEAGGRDNATTTVVAPQLTLGAFDTVDALVEAVEAGGGSSESTPDSLAPTDAVDPTCASQHAVAGGGRTVTTATATLAGDPVVVLLITADDGTRSLVVLRTADCAVLAQRPLSPA